VVAERNGYMDKILKIEEVIDTKNDEIAQL
jgi:hypothetical protein